VLWLSIIAIAGMIIVTVVMVVAPAFSRYTPRADPVPPQQSNHDTDRILAQLKECDTNRISAQLKELKDITLSLQDPHVVSYKNLKIEELTEYLRSPKWFADKDGPFVEDRSYLEFLPRHYVPPKGTRKVLLDLGGREFDSSIIWMRDNYPMTFDEIYVFEGDKGVFKVPAPETIGVQFHKTIHFYEIWLNTTDAPGQLNFPKWMTEALNLTVSDFVVLKMDIENMEWEMLPALERRGLDKVIDELFVEVHFKHPDMVRHGWNIFDHTREQAWALLKHWRDIGVYAHYWP